MSKKTKDNNEQSKVDALVAGTSFSNGSWNVNCKTVGDVISELQRLPANLGVKHGFSDSVDLVVFNRGMRDEHLSFVDGGDWTEDQD